MWIKAGTVLLILSCLLKFMVAPLSKTSEPLVSLYIQETYTSSPENLDPSISLFILPTTSTSEKTDAQLITPIKLVVYFKLIL